MLKRHAVLLVLILIDVISAHPASRQGAPIIDRREELNVRQMKSKEIFKYMKPDVNPCNDFYEYACGNWAQHQRKHMREGEVRTAQNVVELQVNSELQKMLEELLKPQDGQHGRKVRDFYNSCINVENPSSARHNFLHNFVKTNGGLHIIPDSNWPVEYDWVHVVAMLRANYGMDILIGLDIDVNLQTMRGNSIYLGEPKSTLIPAEYCSAIGTQDANINDEAYEEIQRNVAANMQSWLNVRESDANRFAGDVVRLEFELCKVMRQDHSMPDDEQDRQGALAGGNVRYMTGQERIHGMQKQKIQYPRKNLMTLTQQSGNVINFGIFVNESLNTTINSPVYVRNEAYLKQLTRVAKMNPKHSIASYIMYRALQELNFPSDDDAATRPQTCVTLVQRYFPKAIGEMYMQRMQRVEPRNDAYTIFNDIIKAFDERLEVEWLDVNDKRALRQKLQQFKVTFANYDNIELNDLHFERLDYWRKLEAVLRYNAVLKSNRLRDGDYGQRGEAVESYEVRAQLLPLDALISSGWGLLQPPFYHYYYPKAMKYALLAQRFARELIFAFDQQGWNENPLSPMTWKPNTLEAYRNQSECFRAQYSNYIYNNPESFRNASRLRELIADSTALNIAFGAYLNWLQEAIKPDLFKETLPNLNYSNTQLFFIFFAQTHCMARYEEETPPEYLPLDLHKPERFEVNGPLANFEEFGREFGCALGSEMNTDDKCLIY